MAYYTLAFGVVFLPVAIILYQIFPKKFRWCALLLMSLAYYFTYSSVGVRIFLYPITTAAVCFIIGHFLEKLDKKKASLTDLVRTEDDNGKARPKDEIRKEKSEIRDSYLKKSRAVLAIGILLLIAMLLYLKYTNFFIENINHIFEAAGSEKHFALKHLLLPLGISFYTMQAIGYMVDVYWKKVAAEKNPLKLLLFITFFPTIVEGPIASYNDIHEDLFRGSSIDPENIIQGYIRIIWGAVKKLVIADRLYPAVNLLFDSSTTLRGFEVIAAAVLFTVMEYMDFSGSIDMVLGCGRIFGIGLPENFRQPFFARNASEFWRRWHISLGVWFKTYIFYPVSIGSLAKKWNKFAKGRFSKHPTKMVVSAMALLPVWLSNGLWHGPKWTYIFYGIFYFFIILIELIFEPLGDKLLDKLKLTRKSKGVEVIRILRTWIVIFIGELFFRANSLKDGFIMFGNIFKSFNPSIVWNGSALSWGIDLADWIVVFVMLIIVLIVGIIRERGVEITAALLEKPMILRWGLTLGLIMILLVFGLYGPGFQEVDLIYAGF